MKTAQSEYNAIDIMKFVCTLMVVIIHVSPFGSSELKIMELINYVVKFCFVRIAVPFFFVCSGFFLYRKTDYNNFSAVPVKRYIIRMFKLYCIWSAIYFPLCYSDIFHNSKGILNGALLYIKNFFLVGSYYHLWYFTALIFATVVVSFLIYKKIKIRNIIIASAVLYVLGVFTQSWLGLIEPLRAVFPSIWHICSLIKSVILTSRNGLFEGILFVGIGAQIAYNGFKIPFKKALLGMIISYVLLFCEAVFVLKMRFVREYDMYFFLVPAVYFTFGVVQNWRIPSSSSAFKTLRSLSSLVFFTHVLVLWGIRKIFSHIGLGTDEGFVLFASTALFSIALSYLIIKLSETRYFRWLKKIY